LQRIERRVGGPLFRRDRNGSHPTALGEVVLAHAKAVLATVHELGRNLRVQRTGTPTVTRVAATPGTITSEMTTLVPAVVPGTTVDLTVTGDRDHQLELLADGRLELVVCQDGEPRPVRRGDAPAGRGAAADPAPDRVVRGRPADRGRRA